MLAERWGNLPPLRRRCGWSALRRSAARSEVRGALEVEDTKVTRGHEGREGHGVRLEDAELARLEEGVLDGLEGGEEDQDQMELRPQVGRKTRGNFAELKNADRSELRSQWIGRLHRLQLAARADLRADQLEELSNSMIIGIYHLYVRVLPYKDIYRTTSYVYGV